MIRWVIYSVALLLGGFLIPLMGQETEHFYAPILTDMSATDVVLEEDRDLCWTWTFRKARTANPVGFVYFASSRSIAPIPVLFKRGERAVGVTPFEPGAKVSDRYCVKLPAGVAEAGPVRVEGYGLYAVPHGFWTVRQPLPTITYP